MKQWVNKHMIVMWVFASIIYAFIIHCLYSVYLENTWFVAKWSAGEILTYASTVSLGLLAVWQNQKFQRENDKAQERLESIIKHANEIAIINKIVEYETENMHRLRHAFDNFSQACDPQTISSQYANNRTEVINIISAMVIAEQKLDNCFFELGRELRADMQLKKNDEASLKKTFKDYYIFGKKLITKLQQEPLESFEKEMVQLATARDAFIKERERYLVNQENKLNKLLYEDLSIDEIKLLYKRN